MNEKYIMKLESNIFWNTLVQLISIIIIGISILKFNLNSILFSLTICVGLFVLYASSINVTVYVLEDRISIKRINIFKIVKTDQVFCYEDIEQIHFKKGYYNLLNLIYNVPSTNKSDVIIIKLKGENTINEIYLGTRAEMNKVVQIIKEKISN